MATICSVRIESVDIVAHRYGVKNIVQCTVDRDSVHVKKLSVDSTLDGVGGLQAEIVHPERLRSKNRFGQVRSGALVVVVLSKNGAPRGLNLGNRLSR